MTPVSFVRLRHWPGLAPVATSRFDGAMAPTPLPQDRPVRWGILATGGIAATVKAVGLTGSETCAPPPWVIPEGIEKARW